MGTMLGLTLGLSVGAFVVDIVLGTGTPDKAPQSLGTKFAPDDSSWVRSMLGLTLGLSVGALVVDIVLRTGTQTKHH